MISLVDWSHPVLFKAVLAQLLIDVAIAHAAPVPVIPLGVRRSSPGVSLGPVVELVCRTEAAANRLSCTAAHPAEAVEDRHVSPRGVSAQPELGEIDAKFVELEMRTMPRDNASAVQQSLVGHASHVSSVITFLEKGHDSVITAPM